MGGKASDPQKSIIYLISHSNLLNLRNLGYSRQATVSINKIHIKEKNLATVHNSMQ